MAYRPKSWNDKTCERRERRLQRDAEARKTMRHYEFMLQAHKIEEDRLFHEALTRHQHRETLVVEPLPQKGVWLTVREWAGL